MRMSTGPAFDEQDFLAVIAAALDAGITVFDTARVYAPSPGEFGHNERLLARALRAAGGQDRARVVTKGGMSRVAGAWLPDGRAKTIRSDCEASLVALDGLAIDLYLVHAPDLRTPWRTSLRALAALVEAGLVHRVGLSNINRRQLDEALDLAPIAAVQVGLSPLDDRALRGGVVERCTELGIAVMAHSPLGGERGARSLGRNEALVAAAESLGATPAELALAWLLELSPVVVPIPGARRPGTVRSAARAATLRLDPGVRAVLADRFRGPAPARPVGARREANGEVLLVMGIPGAGKSRVAEEHAGRGWVRLNRDARGGSLRDIAAALDNELASGSRRVVLDNTYLTRAARSHVIEVAARHGLRTRCVWLDIPLAQAQVNLVERLLQRFGHLPEPEEVRQASRREQGLMLPASQMRTLRDLEPPSLDEGLDEVQRVPFVRAAAPPGGSVGVFIAAAAMKTNGWRRTLELDGGEAAAYLVFDWLPGGNPGALDAAVARLQSEVSAPVEGAVCAHPGGPPACWCRPPLPGLLVAFARRHDIDPARSVVAGSGPAHRNLAAALGAAYLD